MIAMGTGLKEPPTVEHHASTADQVAEKTWDWGGQAVATGAGAAAIAGLLAGPAGAAVGAFAGGAIGLLLAKLHSRGKQQTAD